MHEERRERLRHLMVEHGVDACLATPSSDMFYLAGIAAHASERPTVLAVLASSESTLVVPQLETSGLPNLGATRVIAYGETGDPAGTLADVVREKNDRPLVAISDTAYASHLLRLQLALPTAAFQPMTPLLRLLRMRKTGQEIRVLREAGNRIDRAFQALLEESFAERTEVEIGERLRKRVRDEGLSDAAWGPIVASGPNSASPHHEAADRRIADGDAILLDFGGQLEGYQADITRTIHVGEPSEKFRHVYGVVREAQEAGVNAARVGAEAQAVDAATRDMIAAAGFADFFIHRTGHGIGLDVHEEPYIVAGNSTRIDPGMAFSVEPGVYLPREFGVRIEDIVVMDGTGGAIRCTEARRDLVIVG